MSSVRLVLIRGVPGSGKTWLVNRDFTNMVNVEANDYFSITGEYKYDKHALMQAHKDCFNRADRLLEEGKSVVVTNTFTRLWEIAPYFELAEKHNLIPRVIRCTGRYPNLHGVPEEKVRQMLDRFEDISGEEIY